MIGSQKNSGTISKRIKTFIYQVNQNNILKSVIKNNAKQHVGSNIQKTKCELIINIMINNYSRYETQVTGHKCRLEYRCLC